MLETQLFEYAIIRVVPRVEREEFMNVGVILYCAKQKFLKAHICMNEVKFLTFSPETEINFVNENLNAFIKICAGGSDAGTIGKLDAASRFRWLTATRSTVLQSSKVHSGFCIDPEETLLKLIQQLVL